AQGVSGNPAPPPPPGRFSGGAAGPCWCLPPSPATFRPPCRTPRRSCCPAAGTSRSSSIRHARTSWCASSCRRRLLVQCEAHLHRHLPVPDLAAIDQPAHLAHLEPAQVVQRLACPRDRLLHELGRAHALT